MKLTVTHLEHEHGTAVLRAARIKDGVTFKLDRALAEYIQKKGTLVSLDELGLPAKTAITQTKSKEFSAGAIYIIDMVKDAFKVDGQ